jgi:hypothetical protein
MTMSDAQSYYAYNDNPRVFVSYGGSVSDALEALAGELRKNSVDDLSLAAINYNEWDGEHSFTAVVTV